MRFQEIILEIDRERDSQELEYGGHGHDRDYSVNDWIALITKHAGKAACVSPYYEEGKEIYRRQMIRVAALACAALEALD